MTKKKEIFSRRAMAPQSTIKFSGGRETTLQYGHMGMRDVFPGEPTSNSDSESDNDTSEAEASGTSGQSFPSLQSSETLSCTCLNIQEDEKSSDLAKKGLSNKLNTFDCKAKEVYHNPNSATVQTNNFPQSNVKLSEQSSKQTKEAHYYNTSSESKQTPHLLKNFADLKLNNLEASPKYVTKQNVNNAVAGAVMGLFFDQNGETSNPNPTTNEPKTGKGKRNKKRGKKPQNNASSQPCVEDKSSGNRAFSHGNDQERPLLQYNRDYCQERSNSPQRSGQNPQSLSQNRGRSRPPAQNLSHSRGGGRQQRATSARNSWERSERNGESRPDRGNTNWQDYRGQDRTTYNDPDSDSPFSNQESLIERLSSIKAIVQRFDTSDDTTPANWRRPEGQGRLPWQSYKVIKPAQYSWRRHDTDKELWLAEMKGKGVRVVQSLDDDPVFTHVEAFVLFFIEKSRISSTPTWDKNLRCFLQVLEEHVEKASRVEESTNLDTYFYLVEVLNEGSVPLEEDAIKIRKFVKGRLKSDDVLSDQTLLNVIETQVVRAPVPPKGQLKDNAPSQLTEGITRLINKGAKFKRLEMGIGMPAEVLNANRCFVLLMESPSATLSDADVDNYKEKADMFAELMDEYVPEYDSVTGNRDEGSFYIIERFRLGQSQAFTAQIRHYENGLLKNAELHSEIKKMRSLSFVKMRKNCEQNAHTITAKKAFLKIYCPCNKRSLNNAYHFNATNPANELKRWICFDCNDDIIYGFDGYLYCSCQVSKANHELLFKCNEKSHGQHYMPLNASQHELSNYLDRVLAPIEEKNILFLGETGVGKSTFINSLANYAKFESLDEANGEDLIAFIPTSFTIYDKNMDEKRISFGEDTNETCQIGMSATQTCRSYTIKLEDKLYHLIDSPGIGDVRGIDQDEINFANILAFISQYPALHGICILLKPNNARLSNVFKFCIKSLLCQLHKNASKNIIFVFTNTRGTFYAPGDTYPTLRTLLDEVRNNEPFVDIPLNKQNTYCFDSEAFRFLIAIREGTEFSDNHKKNFEGSWDHSSAESKRMLKYITNLSPHHVKDTLSLCEARRLIVTLSKPLADISRNIQENLILLDEQANRIERGKRDLSTLQGKLYVPIKDFKRVTYDKPRTVCTSEGCVKVVAFNDKQTIDYVTICHDPCYLQNVQAEIVNNSALVRCAAMNGTSTCTKCLCDWRKHMHVYYKLVEEEVRKPVVTVQNRIQTEREQLADAQTVINECENRRKLLLQEQEVITKSCAKFGHFLKMNAITPYNDALADYLDYLIETEKLKASRNDDKKKVIRHLNDLKSKYEEQVRILEQAINHASGRIQPSSASSLSPQDIKAIIQELYSLKEFGQTIRDLDSHIHASHLREHTVTAVKKKKLTFKKKPSLFSQVLRSLK